MKTWMCGRGWRIDAENRWLHLDMLIVRFLVLCLPVELIVHMLQDLVLVFAASDSLESALVTLLRDNPEDWSSRRKLRLLRIAKTLCAPKVPLLLSVVFVTHKVHDAIMYAILGHGKQKRKIDMCEFVVPDTSPVVAGQAQLVELLKYWNEGNKALALLTLLGADYRDAPLRLRSRAHILRSDAGLVTYFASRLSRPPYSLILLLFLDELGLDVITAVCLDFLSIPLECLPQMCRVWRTRFWTVAMLLEGALPDIWAWSQTCRLAIDFSERSHGQMRTDLRTAGPGKNKTSSTDRMVCRQLKAAHDQQPSAEAPSLPAVLAIADTVRTEPKRNASSSSTQVVPLLPKAAPPPPKPVGHAGSVLIQFRNMRTRTYKLLHARDRTLEDAEVKEIHRKADIEWERIKTDESSRRCYEDWIKSMKRCKNAKAMPDQSEKQTPPERFEGVWRSSKLATMPLDPAAFAAFCESGAAKAARVKLHGEADPDGVSTCEHRTGETPDCMNLVCGCWNRRRNICRDHLAILHRSALDALSTLANRWIDKLPPEERDELTAPCLWLQDLRTGPASSSAQRPGDRDTIVCLADFYLSPKTQLFVRCALDTDSTDSRIYYSVPKPPFRVRMRIGESRMRGSSEALQTVTADELFFEALQRSPTWSVRPLRWHMPEDTDSLLCMDIDSVEQELQIPPRQSKRPRQTKTD